MNEEQKASLRLQLLLEAGRQAIIVPPDERIEFIIKMAKEFEKFVFQEKEIQPMD